MRAEPVEAPFDRLSARMINSFSYFTAPIPR